MWIRSLAIFLFALRVAVGVELVHPPTVELCPTKAEHTCPVCGFHQLTEPPRSRSGGGGGSYEICPCCGFQFGVTDDDRGFSYAQWRKQWCELGMKWSSRQPQPKNWNGSAQLAALENSPSPAKPKPRNKK